MEESKTIRILTHNMQCHYFVSAKNKWSRMEKFLNEISSYDVLLLQELFTVNIIGFQITSLKDWFIGQAKQKGFSYFASPSANRFGQDSGLLILSKFPIVSR